MSSEAADPETFGRVLLKVSGESLKGGRGHGIDPVAVNYMATEIRSVVEMGVEIGVVVGGGNIWRGAEAEIEGMDRATADYAGMLATIISALALQDALERHGVDTRTQSAINVSQIAEPYIRRRAIRHLEKGRVVLFAAGTGNPYVSTDTGAALRAVEIGANMLLMAKHDVDGIYDDDPHVNPNATKLEFVEYFEALEKQLEIMDSSALLMCRENDLGIIVFDMFTPGNLARLVRGETLGTRVGHNRSD
ncbi:MAG TPA: UMP kinase [Dehalococcoidia bacterium]|jgi:uridylate kinase|nr:UMP kinase [SAR202 cluster bacterium]MDP6799655.1 UMP kinase [SAR202 cluster bacterium]MQG57624.1 UMP kinase [SAR202 cluster bacterium]HAL49145.1 UMP kinase [Dehalococcoidia bacterium]|tara:strand:+ start:5505 stop:6251 length:747 start_codon:yes stop_codon:yes gene_type:complete